MEDTMFTITMKEELQEDLQELVDQIFKTISKISVVAFDEVRFTSIELTVISQEDLAMPSNCEVGNANYMTYSSFCNAFYPSTLWTNTI
jgi:hypothetical protein